MLSIESRKALQAKYRAQCMLMGVRLKEAMITQHNVRVDRVVIVPNGLSYVVLPTGKNKHKSRITFEVLQDKFIITIVLTENKQDTRYTLLFDNGGRVHNTYKSMQACISQLHSH